MHPPVLSTEAIARHRRVAFQFSGGKDSTAALFLLRPLWTRMTVYWLNTGDNFPETAAFVRSIAAALPHYVEVPGRVNETIDRFGPPADLIPEAASETAWAMNVGRGARLQDRTLCCARSKMAPMHERMLADGITLVVRGQKAADDFRGPLSSGTVDVATGLEFYYPIERWSDSDVMQYLVQHNLLPPLYDEGLTRSGDCMRCSAWLGDRRASYLAERHPAAFQDYRQRIFTIARAVQGDVERVLSEAAAVA
jgi:3'-phosphoadenosine 5'-phosphosulfate sulfotransferase (PAPS reductase)/FAD synthetase